jgi:hypothetical protein
LDLRQRKCWLGYGDKEGLTVALRSRGAAISKNRTYKKKQEYNLEN